MSSAALPSPLVPVVANENIIVVCSLQNHPVTDNIIEVFFLIVVDINASLTNLGAFLVFHVSVSKRIVQRLLRIE
jgi:hypothetical protein